VIVMIEMATSASATAMTEVMKKSGRRRRAVHHNGTLVKSQGGVGGGHVLVVEQVSISRLTKSDNPASGVPSHHQRCRLKMISDSSWAPWSHSVSSCCKRSLSANGLSASASSVNLGLPALVGVVLSVLVARLRQAKPRLVVVEVAVGPLLTSAVCHLVMVAMATATRRQGGV